MRSIYVIGAQCTGKTTLVRALATWFEGNMPHMSTRVIQETARTMLDQHNFTRNDVRSGGPRCLQLQRLILQSQCQRELQLEREGVDMMIGDRSGIDPIVYTQLYCDSGAVEELTKSSAWIELSSKMQDGIVIVCEPVAGWLTDDGVRLMPLDWEEWRSIHDMFCAMLTDHRLQYAVLSASILPLEERVKFVLSRCGLS